MKRRNKYVTFGFDDGENYDRRVCELLNRYGMKGTFFLISNQLGFRCDFHRYGADTIVERVSAHEICQTYKGMEIATHTANHKCPVEELESTVLRSAEYLSSLCGYPVNGLAYPGGIYTSEHVRELKRLGIRYARTAENTYGFDVPGEWLVWNPTCHYADENVLQLAEEFLSCQRAEPQIFYVWGHSYEMTRREKGYGFADFERLLQRLCGRDDVVYATNLEVMTELQCVIKRERRVTVHSNECGLK